MALRDAWKGEGLSADLAGLGVPRGLVRDVPQGCSSTKTQRKEHSKQVRIESDWRKQSLGGGHGDPATTPQLRLGHGLPGGHLHDKSCPSRPRGKRGEGLSPIPTHRPRSCPAKPAPAAPRFGGWRWHASPGAQLCLLGGATRGGRAGVRDKGPDPSNTQVARGMGRVCVLGHRGGKERKRRGREEGSEGKGGEGTPVLAWEKEMSLIPGSHHWVFLNCFLAPYPRYPSWLLGY